MSFKKAKHKILRGAISPDLSKCCYHYFLNKRKVARLLFDTRWVSPFTTEWGYGMIDRFPIPIPIMEMW